MRLRDESSRRMAHVYGIPRYGIYSNEFDLGLKILVHYTLSLLDVFPLGPPSSPPPFESFLSAPRRFYQKEWEQNREERYIILCHFGPRYKIQFYNRKNKSIINMTSFLLLRISFFFLSVIFELLFCFIVALLYIFLSFSFPLKTYARGVLLLLLIDSLQTRDTIGGGESWVRCCVTLSVNWKRILRAPSIAQR